VAASWSAAGLPGFFSTERYSRSLPDNAVRTQTISGRIRARRKSMKSTEQWDVAWVMPQATISAFVTFYRTTLVEGTQPFQDIKHPQTGANTVWQFITDPVITPWQGGGVDYLVSARIASLPDAPT
jgi:hypothetical protein